MARGHPTLRDVGRVEKGGPLDLARSALLRPVQLQRLSIVIVLLTEQCERAPLMLAGQTDEKTTKVLIRAWLSITTQCFGAIRAANLHGKGATALVSKNVTSFGLTGLDLLPTSSAELLLPGVWESRSLGTRAGQLHLRCRSRTG